MPSKLHENDVLIQNIPCFIFITFSHVVIFTAKNMRFRGVKVFKPGICRQFSISRYFYTAMHYFYTFFLLAGFWLLMSGKFDLFHLTLGLLSCAIVTILSADLLFREKEKKGRMAEAGRFLMYIPWIIQEIFLSTLHVAYLALHPDMKNLIKPRVVNFKTRLRNNIARVTLANSITLTPGTITIRMEDDVFSVHALSSKVAADLPGEMEKKIGHIFGENIQ